MTWTNDDQSLRHHMVSWGPSQSQTYFDSHFTKLQSLVSNLTVCYHLVQVTSHYLNQWWHQMASWWVNSLWYNNAISCNRTWSILVEVIMAWCLVEPSSGPLARHVKLQAAHALGMLPRFSDPDMHHGMCVKHVPDACRDCISGKRLIASMIINQYKCWSHIFTG